MADTPALTAEAEALLDEEMMTRLDHDGVGLSEDDLRDRLAAIEAAAVARLAATEPDCPHHCEEGHYTGDDMAMAEIGTGWPAKWEAALAESEALRKALGALVVAASPVLRTSFAGGTSPDTIGRRIESLRDAYEAAMETLLAPFIEAHNARIMEEAEATQP